MTYEVWKFDGKTETKMFECADRHTAEQSRDGMNTYGAMLRGITYFVKPIGEDNA